MPAYLVQVGRKATPQRLLSTQVSTQNSWATSLLLHYPLQNKDHRVLAHIKKCPGDMGAHRLPSPWREPGQWWCCGPPSAAARSPARAAPARPAATASAAAPAALGKAQPARGPGS